MSEFSFLTKPEIVDAIYKVLCMRGMTLTRNQFDGQYRLNETLWMSQAREWLQGNKWVQYAVIGALAENMPELTHKDIRRMIETGA